MAAYLLPYTTSLTLLVSPHRAGLTVEEARRLIETIHTDDLESSDRRVFYSLTEIAESLIPPSSHLPDPEPGNPVATVTVHGQVPSETQQELLRRWDEAYAQAILHEPL